MSKMHYVPQRYLENFSNKNKQIYAFAKDTQKQFLPNVSGVATEENFYGSQEMEKWFWRPEGKQITSISNLQNKVEEVLKLPRNEVYEASLLSAEDKTNLSEVVAIQFLRTKSLRNL
jgi:Protein of unknown function (DUF4238)